MRKATYLALLTLCGCSTLIPEPVTPSLTTPPAKAAAPSQETLSKLVPPSPASAPRLNSLVRTVFVSSGSPPATVFTTNQSAACDPPPVGLSVCWYAGSGQPGRYQLRYPVDATPSFTFTNLDVRLPWRFTCSWYSNTGPVTNCVTTSKGVTVCLVSSVVEGDKADEVLLVTPATHPFGFVTNGTLALEWWGVASANYAVKAGGSPSEMVVVTNVPGAGGPMYYFSVGTNRAGRFLSVEPE